MASRFINPDSIILDPNARIVRVDQINPRKPGTRGYYFYPRIVATIGQTVGDLLDAARRDGIGDGPAHIRYDISRGRVDLDPPPRIRGFFDAGSSRPTSRPTARPTARPRDPALVANQAAVAAFFGIAPAPEPVSFDAEPVDPITHREKLRAAAFDVDAALADLGIDVG